jgi:hypothetical protein
MKTNNFAKHCLENNGQIFSLNVPVNLLSGTGLMNPSVFVDNDEIYVNLRHIDYTLYHSECRIFPHRFGVLQYVRPEDGAQLTSVNYICKLNSNFEISNVYKLDTTKLDTPPLWDFTGLEDVRLVKWNNKLYGAGCRRDTTQHGEGRIELSEISINTAANEISRFRIPVPDNKESYCEKNWMPVISQPYTFIKWTNPTHVVQVDPINKTSRTLVLDENKKIPNLNDFKGGSQVLTWGDYYVAVVHEALHYTNEINQHDTRYYHRFILWDKNFNIVKISDNFSLMDGNIEFCCGIAAYKDDFLLSFGFQDNAAYLLKFPQSLLGEFLELQPASPLIKDTRDPIPVFGVPIVNGFRWLNKLVDSIDYPITNFIVINNGNFEMTSQLDNLRNSNKHITNFHIINLPNNIGCSSAWNLIIKLYPMAPYWVISNHDVSYPAGFLQKMMELGYDSSVGIVHGDNEHPPGLKLGGWEIFLIRDFVIQEYGLFDENLYPAYGEDIDYYMRIFANGNILKRITTVGIPFFHGDSTDYADGGCQTINEDAVLKSKVAIAHKLNERVYLTQKWGNTWNMCTPYSHPFNNEQFPISYNIYDLEFIRQKYVGH